MTHNDPSGHGHNGHAVKPRRILLVEDDDELREALTDALSDKGHDVTAVGDGRDAIAQMKVSLPELIVLDLMMPVLDGWQFRVEQKRDPKLAETPVVAISASRSPVAAAIDADLYLQKPFDANTLLRAIDDLLAARERRQEPAKQAQAERMAALGTLAAGMAHEINNPMTYVLLNLTHVLRVLPTLSNELNGRKVEQLETLVKGALDGVERIRSVTSGIRAFSRSDDVVLTQLDVRSVLDAAIKMVAHEMRHRARLVRTYLPVPLVRANEGRLGQVFLNLLTNAVQAIPEGHAEAHQIDVRTSVDDQGRIVVEVADSGQGVPESLLSRIFEPFFSTKPTGQGTGLGLSISLGIVASLGGEITVTSHPGRGSTFRVCLPPASAAQGAVG